MELIPILAFIVLVVTIGTFIFSISAYILFKIRESRTIMEKEHHPSAFPAELYTAPVEHYDRPIYQQPQQYVHPDNYVQNHRPDYVPEQPPRRRAEDKDRVNPPAANRFMRYTNQGYVNIPEKKDGNNGQWR